MVNADTENPLQTPIYKIHVTAAHELPDKTNDMEQNAKEGQKKMGIS